MQRSKNTGYSHDLLPIIAAILILLPILLCAFHRVREASEQQTCTENLKRLGVACDMYQTDWDDVLVPYGMPFVWSNRSMWPELLDTYIRKIPGGMMSSTNLSPEYQCPSRTDTAGWAYERTYGMNMKCGGAMSLLEIQNGKAVVVAVSRVKYPHATIRIAEAASQDMGGTLYAAEPSSSDYRQFPERHSGKGNVLWIDGHVSAMTLAQYNMMDTQADRNTWLRLAGPKPAVPAD